MKCKTCNEDYTSEFDEDFVNGECLPCRVGREHDEYCEAEAKELERYNKKNNTDYDDDSFYYACDADEIEASTLKGFPKLRYTKKWNDNLKAEIEYYDKIRNERQLELSFDGEDLPF